MYLSVPFALMGEANGTKKWELSKVLLYKPSPNLRAVDIKIFPLSRFFFFFLFRNAIVLGYGWLLAVGQLWRL